MAVPPLLANKHRTHAHVLLQHHSGGRIPDTHVQCSRGVAPFRPGSVSERKVSSGEFKIWDKVLENSRLDSQFYKRRLVLTLQPQEPGASCTKSLMHKKRAYACLDVHIQMYQIFVPLAYAHFCTFWSVGDTFWLCRERISKEVTNRL